MSHLFLKYLDSITTITTLITKLVYTICPVVDWELGNKITCEMVKRKMKVAGKKVYVNMLLWINSIRIYNGRGMKLPPYQGKYKAIISVSSSK